MTRASSNFRSAGSGIKAVSDSQKGSTSTVRSDFDRIVHAAYKIGTMSLEERRRDNFKFDVDFWENESNMTTEGGLRREDRILLADLYSNADSVFEWGLGESTFLADHVGVPRYAGIDSDPLWVDMARKKVSDQFRFYFADIGSTKDWGFPEDKTLSKNILNYQLEPLIVEQEAFDVYMVDGRYRLACALASFLHASARGGDKRKTTVLIHDCDYAKGGGVNRDVYKAADHLLDMVDHSGARLCVYKRKPKTTDQQLSELWLQHSVEVMR